MIDCNGRIIQAGDIVLRHNANNGWAADDCEVPLLVVKAPETCNRKLELLNLKTKEKERFVEIRNWQDMGASGHVYYTYEIISLLDVLEKLICDYKE